MEFVRGGKKKRSVKSRSRKSKSRKSRKSRKVTRRLASNVAKSRRSRTLKKMKSRKSKSRKSRKSKSRKSRKSKSRKSRKSKSRKSRKSKSRKSRKSKSRKSRKSKSRKSRKSRKVTRRFASNVAKKRRERALQNMKGGQVMDVMVRALNNPVLGAYLKIQAVKKLTPETLVPLGVLMVVHNQLVNQGAIPRKGGLYESIGGSKNLTTSTKLPFKAILGGNINNKKSCSGGYKVGGAQIPLLDNVVLGTYLKLKGISTLTPETLIPLGILMYLYNEHGDLVDASIDKLKGFIGGKRRTGGLLPLLNDPLLGAYLKSKAIKKLTPKTLVPFALIMGVDEMSRYMKNKKRRGGYYI